ncbi:MAG: hypothetical protein GY940_30415 [bacterium]|nr:hypothetical protein [bacterium]
MKTKMKINLKKLFTVVTLLVGLSVAGFGVELPSSEVRDAAMKGLDLYLKSDRVSPEQIAKMGLSSAQAVSSILTEGFQVYKVNSGKLLYSAESFDRIVEPTGKWRFLAVSGNQAVSLITVVEMKGRWTPVQAGGAGIAAKLQQILETWPLLEGYEFRFIRIHSAVQDLVEVSREGDVLGYVSLSVLPGMEEVKDNGFDAGMLYSESDFRGSLSDSVEANRRHAEEMEASSVMPSQQPGLSGTSGYSEGEELSTVNTTTENSLDVDEEIQDFSQWCWAACSRAILKYYGVGIVVNIPPFGNILMSETQCFLADWAWKDAGYNYGAVCEVSSGEDFYKYSSTNGDWNDPNYMYSRSGSIDAILEHRGVSASGSGTYLSYSSVKSEINADRPFVMRYGWLDNQGNWDGGHFIVGYGYRISVFTFWGMTVTMELISYMNPWPGEGFTEASYDWAVYEANDHAWTHTLTTSY